MTNLNAVLGGTGAIGAGLSAGVFFAFSTFVMPALGRLPAAQGVAAMQAINVSAPNPWFMTALFGTALVSVAAAVTSLRRLDDPGAVHRLVGGVTFLAGIALTVVYHVPHNDALAVLDPSSARAATAWSRYLPAWSAWNHVRTLTSAAAAVAFTLGLRAG